MKVLVIAEHDGRALRPASLSCMQFARDVADQTDGTATWLVLGDDIQQVSEQAKATGDVLMLSAPCLAHPIANQYAQLIHDVADNHGFDLVAAAATSFAKDIVSRAGGLLGGAMASEVVAHRLTDEGLEYDRPTYAGAVLATVRLKGHPQIVTVRPSSYPAVEPGGAAGQVTLLECDVAALPGGMEFVSVVSKANDRPDVTEARIVVSGGRAIKNSEDYERLVGGLADALQAATGSSRALVDAGIAPNETQVGQTGKIVAPDLYVALGISGAVQHLAGMKNAKTIVAINTDPDAPMFEVADYGLRGDVYEIVPQLIEALEAASKREHD